MDKIEELNKNNSEPNTRKYMKSKRKKNKLKEYGNMTEMLAEEIKRISKISTKNKSNSKSPKASCGYINSSKNSK